MSIKDVLEQAKEWEDSTIVNNVSAQVSATTFCLKGLGSGIPGIPFHSDGGVHPEANAKLKRIEITRTILTLNQLDLPERKKKKPV